MAHKTDYDPNDQLGTSLEGKNYPVSGAPDHPPEPAELTGLICGVAAKAAAGAKVRGKSTLVRGYSGRRNVTVSQER